VWLSQFFTSDLEHDEKYDEQDDIPNESMLADLHGMSAQAAAEQLYYEHREARQRFRRWTGMKGKGKGFRPFRGKGEDKGSGKGTYFGGKKNPVGADGRIVTCSTRGSEDTSDANARRARARGAGRSPTWAAARQPQRITAAGHFASGVTDPTSVGIVSGVASLVVAAGIIYVLSVAIYRDRIHEPAQRLHLLPASACERSASHCGDC